MQLLGPGEQRWCMCPPSHSPFPLPAHVLPRKGRVKLAGFILGGSMTPRHVKAKQQRSPRSSPFLAGAPGMLRARCCAREDGLGWGEQRRQLASCPARRASWLLSFPARSLRPSIPAACTPYDCSGHQHTGWKTQSKELVWIKAGKIQIFLCYAINPSGIPSPMRPGLG